MPQSGFAGVENRRSEVEVVVDQGRPAPSQTARLSPWAVHVTHVGGHAFQLSEWEIL
jgi:hypothetical protein